MIFHGADSFGAACSNETSSGGPFGIGNPPVAASEVCGSSIAVCKE